VGTYDTFMYTYIAGAKVTNPANRGEFYKYASTADIWTTGGTNPAVSRASAAPRERYSEYPLARAGVGECGLGGRACGAACGLERLSSAAAL
jgi:hypothetical protein